MLYSAVVDLLEITLLPQFIIGRASLLGGYPGLVKVLLEHSELIAERAIGPVDLGYLRQPALIKLPFGLEFEPLLLELLESAAHPKLDEEVAEELIRALGLVGADRGRIVVCDPELLCRCFHQAIVVV